jgi:multidrug efflux system membrane fusion protein
MSNLAGSTNEPSLKQMPEEPERRDIEATPTLPVKLPARRYKFRPHSHRRRALRALSILGLALAAWWASGCVLAYTDDAYVTSDLVSVTPEVTGPIAAVHVVDNQLVKRGTPLFTIDPTPFRLEVQQARSREAEAAAQLPVDEAEVKNLQAQQDAAETALKLDTANLGRDSTLAHSGYVTQRALDMSRTTQERSTAQLRASQAAVQRANQMLKLHQAAVVSAHSAVSLAEWQLDRTNVVAPVDGHVTDLAIQVGDMVSPSKPAVAVVDAHAWRVIANYKEYYLRHLTPGHEAWVWLDTRPWHLYRARIQGIARGISRTRGNQSLVPYVSPTVDWIRLQRRIPVRLVLLNAGTDNLFMGADARTLVIY